MNLLSENDFSTTPNNLRSGWGIAVLFYRSFLDFKISFYSMLELKRLFFEAEMALKMALNAFFRVRQVRFCLVPSELESQKLTAHNFV